MAPSAQSPLALLLIKLYRSIRTENVRTMASQRLFASMIEEQRFFLLSLFSQAVGWGSARPSEGRASEDEANGDMCAQMSLEHSDPAVSEAGCI